MSVIAYFFFSQDKDFIEEIENTHVVHDKPRLQEEIEPFVIETLSEIEEVKKDISKPKSIDEKTFVLSSATIDIYEISLNSYLVDDNTSKKEILHCMLKLRERELFFDLSINKSMLKNRDELFISVTTNQIHTVTEDAYLLKSLDEDINYLLVLTLYYDYVNLSLIELGDKKVFKPLRDINVTNDLGNLKFSINGKNPINIADNPLAVEAK